MPRLLDQNTGRKAEIMQPNHLKAQLEAGQVPVGHMIWEFGTRGVASLAAQADLDFVLLDMEHGAFTSAQIADQIAWFRTTSVTPIVRVPQAEYHFIARTLDAGAMGIMMPNVRTPDMAGSVVEAAKYAPLGRRGLGLGGSVTRYETGDPKQQMDALNASTAIICQIESVEGLNHLDAIAAVAGVDVLWVGQSDLSQSLGIPGQFDHPDFQAALQRVIACCRQRGLGAGIQPSNLAQCRQWMDIGFNVISFSVDTAVYAEALANARQAVDSLAAALT